MKIILNRNIWLVKHKIPSVKKSIKFPNISSLWEAIQASKKQR